MSQFFTLQVEATIVLYYYTILFSYVSVIGNEHIIDTLFLKL